jgi:glycosidase
MSPRPDPNLREVRMPDLTPARRRHAFGAIAASALLALAGSAAAQSARPVASTAAMTPTTQYDGVGHPEWVKDTAIYELSLRAFTPEGTLAAARKELPRLKALGVGVVWLMPIHPVGKVKPAGPLGSPYAIRDFRAVDPAYGSMDDLKAFVAEAHAQGLKVILDWVGNHSAWDNPLVTQHPDWYTRDSEGQMRSPPWFGWADVVEFDYASPGLRRYMADSMAFWVREGGVDGFRADAAGLVPLEFWEQTRAELDAIKPVFMLAEWESRDLHFKAFDASYAWSYVRAIEGIAKGHGGLDELRAYYAWDQRFWARNGLRLLYVSNHDENAWQGTEFERYGPALDAAIALSIASDGMPLIYNGQEAGNPKRLKMFERDPIAWRPHPEGELYRDLLAFKKRHPALWNRPWGGPMIEIGNDKRAQVLSFTRTRDDDTVLAVFNLSPQPQAVALKGPGLSGAWRDQGGDLRSDADGGLKLDLKPWGYRLFVRAKAPG